MAGNVLERILAVKRQEVARLKAAHDPRKMRQKALAAPPARDFLAALQTPPLAVIAEIKKASPSAGELAPGRDVAAQARAYAAGGAAALSVLTDQQFFGGSLADLAQARASVDLPLLRKDFVIDPAQLYEARLAGADAALLIVAALSPNRLEHLYREALAVGLTPLVEVHSAAELATALALNPPLIGVNNRDLTTLKVDLVTCLDLAARVPAGATLVAESGIAGPADVARLVAGGIRACLVGTALMLSPDPAATLRSLVEAA